MRGLFCLLGSIGRVRRLRHPGKRRNQKEGHNTPVSSSLLDLWPPLSTKSSQSKYLRLLVLEYRCDCGEEDIVSDFVSLKFGRFFFFFFFLRLGPWPITPCWQHTFLFFFFNCSRRRHHEFFVKENRFEETIGHRQRLGRGTK